MTHLACYPYGTGHGDVGVCLRLEIGEYRILLDCGLQTIEPIVADALFSGRSPADVVICSHAHGDHARGLLALRQHFADLPLYASEVTTQLLTLNWPTLAPSASISCQSLPWRSPLQIRHNLTIELIPSGHLPGAAAVLLTYTTADGDGRPVRVLYTGDFSLSNARLVEGLRLEELRGLAPDVLIVEASYGNTRHPHRRQQENELMARMAQSIGAGQSVLLPVPTLGLGQELLFLLRSHYLFSGRALDIWVHGHVAEACERYLTILDQFPSPVQNFARNQSLFWDTRIQPRTARLSAAQLADLGRCNFSGMATIVFTDTNADLSEFCRSGDWLVLLPEFLEHQAQYLLQPSRSPQNQDQTSAIIKAETYWLSEHSDGNATLQLIHSLRPQHVLLVHGSIDQLADFANLDELNSRYKVHIPMVGSAIELTIGDLSVNLPAPETCYESEVVITPDNVGINLPIELTQDPRWQAFLDTGIVETYWRGDELVMRSVSARTLLTQSATTSRILTSSTQPHCRNCTFYRSRRCINQSSPLFNLQVTPDGNCPSFEVIQDV
jgi:Cft2 family RNA processing exonuclease